MVKVLFPDIKVKRPLLRWVGGKFDTAVSSRVKQLFAGYRDTHTYIDPMVGSGGMLLDLDPIHAHCYDGSWEVAAFHNWIKLGGKIDLEYYPLKFTEADYYRQRLVFREMQLKYYQGHLTEINWNSFATLMLWLNRAGFNSLWRVNQKGLFNVPCGKDSQGFVKKVTMPDLPEYRGSWVFDHRPLDYKLMFPRDAFLYLDPPYWDTFSQYTAKQFTRYDHINLAQWASMQKCPVVISNSNFSTIRNLYKDLGFTVEEILVPRSVCADGTQRGKVIEILAYKNFD